MPPRKTADSWIAAFGRVMRRRSATRSYASGPRDRRGCAALAADPAGLGDVDLLAVRPAVFDLVGRARPAGGPAMPHVGPIRHGPGPGLVELPARLVDVVDHESEVMDAAVARHVAGALAVPIVPGLEDGQIDVAVREVAARPRLADLL